MKHITFTVFQVIRRTNGSIKTIKPLPARRSSWSTWLVHTPSKDIPYREEPHRGRPTALPHQLVPIKSYRGRPLAGTLHIWSHALQEAADHAVTASLVGSQLASNPSLLSKITEVIKEEKPELYALFPDRT
jgi:hypothetical protein